MNDKEKVEVVEPEAEPRAGYFPGRGSEQHGVKHEGTITLPPESHFDDTPHDDLPQYDEYVPDPTPVPVTVVRDRTPRDLVHWRAMQVPLVQNTPTMLVGRQIERQRLLLRVASPTSGESAFIGDSPSGASLMNGFKLRAADGIVEMFHSREVYAMSPDAVGVTVHVITEFSVDV